MLNVPAYYLTRLNTIFANKTPHENVVKSGVGYHVVMGQIRSEASRTDTVCNPLFPVRHGFKFDVR